MIPAALTQFLRRHRVRRTINGQDFSRRPPLVVFQMGNVGSSTVYETLLHSSLPNPVYHVHYMTGPGIRAAIRFHKSLEDRSVPDELWLGEALAGKMERCPLSQWCFITMVRDPVEQAISAFFHNARTHYPEIFDKGDLLEDKALARLQEVFAGQGRENPRYSWFAQEFQTALGVDVLRHPFDPASGWAVIRHKRLRVLILRLENLAQSFFPGITALLDGPSPFDSPWVTANISREKDYYSVYEHVKNNFRLTQEQADSIYSDPHVQHFYGAEEITSFKNKWSAN